LYIEMKKRMVILETIVKEDRLIFGSGYSIKSWDDLFQIDNKSALFYDDETSKELL
jgi:hypothetical protein